MKNNIYFFFIIIIVSFSGCEKVIDVDLDTAAPRLVIDAQIKWQKGTNGHSQIIKLSTTTGYYETLVPKVSGATVFVTDSKGNVFNFIETTENGDYKCEQFIPALNGDYTLTVLYKNQAYTATETLKPVPKIEQITDKESDGFSGKYIQINAFYIDNAATDDFYLFRYKASTDIIPTYDVSEDEFYQGNLIFGIYISDKLVKGQNIDITLSGISERYFNYMSKIISISSAGGPFQSPPASLRGNIINTTDENNYALGYFSLSEADTRNHIIQ